MNKYGEEKSIDENETKERGKKQAITRRRKRIEIENKNNSKTVWKPDWNTAKKRIVK